MAEKDFDNFFPPKDFGLKEPYVLTKIETNMIKDYDFANIARIDIFICRLKKNIFYFPIEKKIRQFKKKIY